MLHILKLYVRAFEKCLVIPSFLRLRTQTYFLSSLLSTRVERSDDWKYVCVRRLQFSYPLSSAEALAGYPYKNSNNRKNNKRAGDHRSPRALFFFLSSLPATQRGLCGGESVLAKNIQWSPPRTTSLYMYL